MTKELKKLRDRKQPITITEDRPTASSITQNKWRSRWRNITTKPLRTCWSTSTLCGTRRYSMRKVLNFLNGWLTKPKREN